MAKPVSGKPRVHHTNRHMLLSKNLSSLIPDDLKGLDVNVEVWYDIQSNKVCMSVYAGKDGKGTLSKHKINVRLLIETAMKARSEL